LSFRVAVAPQNAPRKRPIAAPPRSHPFIPRGPVGECLAMETR
jgi:hypothetical protein